MLRVLFSFLARMEKIFFFQTVSGLVSLQFKLFFPFITMNKTWFFLLTYFLLVSINSNHSYTVRLIKNYQTYAVHCKNPHSSFLVHTVRIDASLAIGLNIRTYVYCPLLSLISDCYIFSLILSRFIFFNTYAQNNNNRKSHFYFSIS